MRSAKMTLVFLGGATVASVFTATPSLESLLSMLSPAAAAASALFSSSADVDGRFPSSSSPLPGQKKSCRKSVVVGRERMPLFASRSPRSSLRGRGAPRVAPLLLRRRGVRLGLLRVRLSPLLLAPRGSRSGRIHRPPESRARYTPTPRPRSPTVRIGSRSLRLSCLFGAFEYPPPSRGGRLNPHVAVRMRFWGTCP